METISVKGMSCEHCVKAVTAALQSIDGVGRVRVSLQSGTAAFELLKPVDLSVIRDKIRQAGYDVD